MNRHIEVKAEIEVRRENEMKRGIKTRRDRSEDSDYETHHDCWAIYLYREASLQR